MDSLKMTVTTPNNKSSVNKASVAPVKYIYLADGDVEYIKDFVHEIVGGVRSE